MKKYLSSSVSGPALIAAVALLLSGCFRNEPTHFYLLTPELTSSQSLAEEGNHVTFKSVGIEPIYIPEYLDRKEILTRTSENEIDFSDLHRWAESLSTAIPRVIAENLRSALKDTKVALLPERSGEQPAVVIHLEIINFAREGNQVKLTVEWSLRAGTGVVIKPISMRQSYSADCHGDQYPETVGCMSTALAVLSQDIVQHLKENVRPKRR